MSNYNSRDVWLGMAIPALIFALAFSSAPAIADCRLNCQDGNKRLHGPYSTDTDRELRASNFRCGSTPSDANNDDRRVTAYARVGGFCDELAPAELRALVIDRDPIIIDAAATGETCAYTDTDGNQYALPDWVVKVQKIRRDFYDFAAPRDWCYYGVSLSAWGTAADKVN